MGYPEETESSYKSKERETRGLPLEEQNKLIAELQDSFAVLLDRLETVLTPEPLSTPDNEVAAKPESMQSPLARELEGNNFRIRRVTGRLNNLLDRLEV